MYLFSKKPPRRVFPSLDSKCKSLNLNIGLLVSVSAYNMARLHLLG